MLLAEDLRPARARATATTRSACGPPTPPPTPAPSRLHHDARHRRAGRALDHRRAGRRRQRHHPDVDVRRRQRRDHRVPDLPRQRPCQGLDRLCGHEDPTSARSDGTYTFAVRARDSAGNQRVDEHLPPRHRHAGDADDHRLAAGDRQRASRRAGRSPATAPAPTSAVSPTGRRPDGLDDLLLAAHRLARRPQRRHLHLHGAGQGRRAEHQRHRDRRHVHARPRPPAAPVLTVEPGDAINDTTPTWEYTTGGTTGPSAGSTRARPSSPAGAAASRRRPTTSPAEATASTRSASAASTAPRTSARSRPTPSRSTPPRPPRPSFTATPADGLQRRDARVVLRRGRAARRSSAASRAGRRRSSGWAACATSFTHDLSGDADGTYTLNVRATDAAGNGRRDRRATASTPPPRRRPPIGTEPPATGSATSPSWAFTGEGGASFECRVMQGRRDGLRLGDVHEREARTRSRRRPTGRSPSPSAPRTPPATSADETSRTYELDRVSPPRPRLQLRPRPPPATGPVAELVVLDRAATTVECRLARGSTRGQRLGDLHVAARAGPDRAPTATTRCACARATPPATSARRPSAATSSTASLPARRHHRRAGGRRRGHVAELAVHRRGGRDAPVPLVTGATVVSDWATCTSPRTTTSLGEPRRALHVRRARA